VTGLSKAGHYKANTLSNKLKRRKDDRKPVWITLQSDYTTDVNRLQVACFATQQVRLDDDDGYAFGCRSQLTRLQWCVERSHMPYQTSSQTRRRSVRTASSFLRRERPKPGAVDALQTFWKMARTLAARQVAGYTHHTHTHNTVHNTKDTSMEFTLIVCS